MSAESCLFCGRGMTWSLRDAVNVVDCGYCGKYHLTGDALARVRKANLTARQRANISGWLVENQPFTVTEESLDWLPTLSTPSFSARADKVLQWIEQKTESAGQSVPVDEQWTARGWCLNDDERREILAALKSMGRIEAPDLRLQYKITPAGWARLEELRATSPDSDQGFVAMWFDAALRGVYEGTIAPGISDAGYKPHRVDQREHNDKIDDEIITQIRRSRFVVADFTGHRGGVYYEAGFAKGLGLEVIWSCRKDHLDKLHFDIRQYNCIDWEQKALPEFRTRLALRIESVLGRGKWKPTGA